MTQRHITICLWLSLLFTGEHTYPLKQDKKNVTERKLWENCTSLPERKALAKIMHKWEKKSKIKKIVSKKLIRLLK